MWTGFIEAGKGTLIELELPGSPTSTIARASVGAR